MERLILLTLLLMSMTGIGMSQSATLHERLGYHQDDKLLIIHADDLGVAHSENAASISAIEKGDVNSGSIMVPCPWFPEIASYANNHPETDLGLHLTLTAEWRDYKWGPVAGRNKVSGLVNKQGYFYDNCAEVVQHASEEEVEAELVAQIEKALDAGIPVTHLDSHMGCLFNPKFFSVYLKVGRDYKLPTLLSSSDLRQFPGLASAVSSDDLMIEKIYGLSPQDLESGVENYYEKVLRNLEPGISEILIHVAYDNEEMKSVCIDHPDYGSTWRQNDYNFFTSEKCKKIIAEENIKMITWREIKTLLDED